MISLPISIKQNSYNPSLPLPLEVFANGPEPNLVPSLGDGGRGKQVMGGVQRGFPQHLGPMGSCQVEGGDPGDSPYPKWGLLCSIFEVNKLLQ
jgi:hypothetical protein